jgi:hypothetical protein
VKRCGCRLRVEINWVDGQERVIGWVLMSRARDFEFTGQIRGQY